MIMPPAMRRTIAERLSVVSFSDAKPMLNSMGNVPKPKQSIMSAPFIGLALVKLHARAE